MLKKITYSGPTTCQDLSKTIKNIYQNNRFIYQNTNDNNNRYYFFGHPINFLAEIKITKLAEKIEIFWQPKINKMSIKLNNLAEIKGFWAAKKSILVCK